MASTLVFLPGEFHGQKSLVGYTTWACKESDMTEQLTLSLSQNLTPAQITTILWVSGFIEQVKKCQNKPHNHQNIF